jgi:hypothetical protein
MSISFNTIEPRVIRDSQKLNDIFSLTGSLLTDENLRYGALQRRHFEEPLTFNIPSTTVSVGDTFTVNDHAAWQTIQQITQTNIFADRPEVFRCNFQAEVIGSTISGTSPNAKASQFTLFRVWLDGVGQIGNIFTLGAHGVTNGNGGPNNFITIQYEKLLIRQYYIYDGTSPFTSSFFRLEGRVADNGLGAGTTTTELSRRYGFSVRHKE